VRRLVLGVVVVLVAGCGGAGAPKSKVDPRLTREEIQAARDFTRFPLYWAGRRFEKWPVRRIVLPAGTEEFATIVYGDCTPSGGDESSCTPPLEIQVFPLCLHLDVLTSDPAWRTHRLRGAPVGSLNGIPVLLASRVQVEVYRGEGSSRGDGLRGLRALRSLNRVAPVVSATGRIPGASTGLLSGSIPCHD